MITGRGLAAVGVGVFLGALDQTVVATLLPTIIADLEVPFTRLHDAAWIVNGYLLGYTVAMPVVGRLADRRGRVTVYLGCLVLFALASIACGAAQSLEWLIVARAIQAVGGGALLPITLAMAGHGGDARGRGLALGIVGAVAEAGGVLGPLYGAALVQGVSWRVVFYLNVPLALVIGALVLLTCREQRASRGEIDVPGALLLAGSLSALAIGLSREGAFHRVPTETLALVGVAALLFVGFIVVERRTREPILPLELFRLRAFAAANLVNLLVGAALIVAMVDLPLWAATVMGRSATEGGLMLLRLTALIPVGAVIGGWLTRPLGPRPPALIGLLATAAGFLLLARWPAAVDDVTLTRDLAIGGLGFGLLLAPLTATAIAWAGDERGAVAAALVTLMRMVGMMIGLGALTSYGLGRFNVLVADLPLPFQVEGESAEAFATRQAAYTGTILDSTVTVFHEIFVAAAALCLLALIPALILRLPKSQEATGWPDS